MKTRKNVLLSALIALSLTLAGVAAAQSPASNGFNPGPGGTWVKHTSAGTIICDSGVWVCRLVQDV